MFSIEHEEHHFRLGVPDESPAFQLSLFPIGPSPIRIKNCGALIGRLLSFLNC